MLLITYSAQLSLHCTPAAGVNDPDAAPQTTGKNQTGWRPIAQRAQCTCARLQSS